MAKKKNLTESDRYVYELLAKLKADGKYTPGPIQAGELMRRLESDPEWVRKRDEREAELERKHQEYQKIEASVVDDLRHAGCEVNSVWDLVNGTPETYAHAVPVLVHHLGNSSHRDKVRESCARALSKKQAGPYFDTIIDIFQTMPNTGANKAKWATANALGVSMTRDRLEKAFEILFDPNHDVACKHILYYHVKRFKIPTETRVAIEAVFSGTEYDKDNV